MITIACMYMFLYVYMYDGVGRTSAHPAYNHQSWLEQIHLSVCGVMCFTQTTSQVWEHMRNISHLVIEAASAFFEC